MTSSMYTLSVRGILSCATLCLFAGSMACEQPRWDDPAYIQAQLEKKDPTMRTVALDKMDGLKEEQIKTLVPILTKVYLEKDSNQKEIMGVLVKMRDPAAKDAYIEEVKTNATEYAAVAAEALGDAKITEAIPDILALLEKTDNNELKKGLLRGMQLMPDASMVPALTKLLQLDADNNPIALHAYSCEIMGEIAQKTPQALDVPAIQALTKAMFLSNKTNQRVSRECGFAVQQLGKSGVKEMVKVYSGERQDVQMLMRAYKLPPNQSKGVATARLSKLQAAEAGPLFLAELSKKQEIPPKLKGDLKLAWVQMQIQVLQEATLGLGDLRHAPAKDTLVAVLRGDKNVDLDVVLDYTSETLLRQSAANTLNAIGDRSATKDLLQAAQTGVINDLEKLARLQEKKGQAMGGLQRYSFNVTTAQAWLMLAPAGELDAGTAALLKSTPAKNAEVKAFYDSFAPVVAASKECTAKADDAQKAACYTAKLKDKSALVRQKGAFELARMPSAVAAPVLAKNISVDSLATREVLTQALYAHPSKAAVSAVEALLKKEASVSGTPARADRLRLKMLLAWLKNNS